MECILDTNFIVSCIRRRIDFMNDLKALGFKVVLPREVLQELKDIRMDNRKTSSEDRTAIDVAMSMFEKQKIKKVGLGGGKVDDSLIKKGKEGVYIASLDAGVKRNVSNRVVIDNAGNKLVVERG